MTHVYIREIGGHEGATVTLRGWVSNQRSSGKLQFLMIRDGSGIIQGVVSRAEVSPEVWEACQSLTLESSVQITGSVRADSRAPSGFELSVTNAEPFQIAVDYPITPKEHGVDFLMDRRHLWIRSSRQHALLRVRARVIRAMREFLDGRGFIQVDTPILTPAACEGTTTLFETQYFDEKAYLSQSGQLYNEATAMAFGRVYCFCPAFRAEKSKTRRHLIEFWMLEPEMAWCTQEENERLQEELVTFIVQAVLADCEPELKLLGRDLDRLANIRPPFPRITYEEALQILEEAGEPLPFGQDFGAPHETLLSNRYDRPLFVQSFPVAVKAFYMQPQPDRPELAVCADLLAPEGVGEIIGGGQRIHDLALLERRLEEHGLPREQYEWYLDLRRFGTVPHSGFGIGVERTVGWICGIEHVRETIPFPRTLYRLYP
ncbi:MAG: asparagine--tRNA ligase [Chloroflexi bacterium]|nr:asparagine--tRNA ligase [Chloroflexota bacterium]